MKKSNLSLILLFILLPIFSFSQQSLDLASCVIEEYAINDHSDSDNDGNVCEAKLSISNSASYFNDEICQLSSISWTVFVDLNGDGTDDLEYSSNLPSNDMTLDDTNGNGIPDQYISTTTNNGIQYIHLPDLPGPSSTHNITWMVSDECNLSDVCNTSFTVQDKKAPTPYCTSGFTLVFDGPTFEIFAEDFNVGSFDNCTEQEDLRFSFSGDSIVSSKFLTCDDFNNSPVEFRMYVWDDLDNVDYCITSLTLIPGPTTDCFEPSLVKGVVKDWGGNLLEGVEVILDANIVEYPRVTYTNAQGEYFFHNVQNGFQYRLSANFDDDNYLSEVSTLDLVLIVRHLLGLQTFENPYQIIAADINGDYKVQADDIFSMRKLILGVINEIPTNKPWLFLRSNYEFSNPLDPFFSITTSVEDPFVYEFNTINYAGYDFTGVKTGDITN